MQTKNKHKSFLHNLKIKRNNYLHYLNNFALDTGLLKSSSDYCKFIILAHERTGSNFLHSLLVSNPQIICFGELFNKQVQGIDWKNYRYPQSQELNLLLENNPITFLNQEVFKRFPHNTQAVGFKLFYHHARDSNQESVWTWLQSNKAIKIIHLKRKNILKTILSFQKALRTNRWITKKIDAEDPLLKIELDYEYCLESFNKIRDYENQATRFFQDQEIIDIYYEDLVDNYKEKISNLYTFLNVDNNSIIRSMTKKQSHQNLSQAIANYDELKQRFMGTCWQQFFEE